MSEKAKLIRLVISIICIGLAFCFGYLFALERVSITTQETQKIINIKTSDESLKISEVPQNILFRINGKIMQEKK